MQVFRPSINGLGFSPVRSVYGVNQGGKIIVPLDLCVLTQNDYSNNLPSQLLAVQAPIVQQGGNVIGNVIYANNPSPITVDPVVKLQPIQPLLVNFQFVQPVLPSDPGLIGNPAISFTASSGTVFNGTLLSTNPQSSPYLSGLFTVNAYTVNFPNPPNDSTIGSMVMLNGKSLGMFLGTGGGSFLVYPSHLIN